MPIFAKSASDVLRCVFHLITHLQVKGDLYLVVYYLFTTNMNIKDDLAYTPRVTSTTVKAPFFPKVM